MNGQIQDSRLQEDEPTNNCVYKYEIKGFLTVLSVLFAICLSPVTSRAEGAFEAAGEFSAVISEEFKTGFEEKSYFLQVSATTVHRLFFDGDLPVDAQSGDFAFVRGEFVSGGPWGDGILVHSIYVLPRAQSVVSGASAARNALVMVINFNDTSAGCSNAAAESIMWSGSTSINGLFEESSFNTIAFPPDTNADSNADVLNVNLAQNIGTSCDYFNWAIDADTAAVNAGFDLNQYQHRVYILPQSAPCGWAGLGNLGCGTFCRAWTLYCDTPDVLAHELGHNLGLNHARTDSNNDGNYDCEYCDTSGIMGYGGIGFRHFNAPHKAYLGWIPASGVQTATEDGSYSLAVNEVAPVDASPSPPSEFQVVRTRIPGQSNEYYYLSYRAQLGAYSSNLPEQYRNKVNIHRVTDGSSYSTYVGSLASGESWSDGNGVRISSVSLAATHATFSLSGVSDGGVEDPGSGECSVSGTVLKNGQPPRNYRKLRVILKRKGIRGRKRSRVSSDGSYSISNCQSGDSRIKVQRRKTRRRRGRAIVPYQGLTAGADVTKNFTLTRRRWR